MYRDEIEKYIAQLGKAENTCESYRRDLIQMDEFLRANEGAGIGDYAEHIATTKATSSVARIYSAINGFCRYLIDTGAMDANPMDGHTAPKVVKNPRPAFDDARKSEIVAMPKGYGNKAVRDRAMFAVMFDTGYKVTKLIGLKLQESDSLEISAATREILDDYIYGTRERMLGGKPSDMLFTNCSGEPLSRQGFWKIFKSYTDTQEEMEEV